MEHRNLLYEESILDCDEVKEGHGKYKVDCMALAKVKPAPPKPVISFFIKRHNSVLVGDRITLAYNRFNTIL